MMIERAKIASDQNGYAGIESSAPIALRPPMKIPNQRPNSPPANSEKAAISSSTPMIRVIQPQVWRPLMM